MSADPSNPSRQLPENPNLRHLKDQAKKLLKQGANASLAEAQREIANQYGFASWPKLKAYVDEKNLGKAVAELKHAIDSNDLEQVKSLMTRNRGLHRAPLGYGKNGPLTWVAECRVPWEAPGPVRLAMAQWMIDNGSDVHQGGDGPLMRAALVDARIPMMELLVRNGADVNAQWNGHFPIIFAPCETLAPGSLRWLLDHGARTYDDTWQNRTSALDYVIGTYSRSERLSECIDILLDAGCPTRRDIPPMLDLLRNRIYQVRKHLDADPSLVHRRFPELDFGSTAYRRLTLKGATLLHVAAEYGNPDAAGLLLERGADVNAKADVDALGVGGQTPIFHAASQFFDFGLPMLRILLEHGADLSTRARLPGHYERKDEFVECTPLEYATQFPGGDTQTLEVLRAASSHI